MKLGHIILTGERNSGKSIRLLSFYKEHKDKIKISGWISVPFVKNGAKIGYDIVFLNRSVLSKPQRFFRIKPFPLAKKWRNFYVDFSVFERAEKIAKTKKNDIFIIDEVGPLEIFEKKGYYPLLDKLYSANRTTITVVRSELVYLYLKQLIK